MRIGPDCGVALPAKAEVLSPKMLDLKRYPEEGRQAGARAKAS
jgi:hypothetical protein